MALKHRFVVGLWVLGLFFACWLTFFHTRYVADLASFLPTPESPVEALMIAQLSDGVASRLLLIGLEGASPEHAASASKAMARELRESGRFRYVANGENPFDQGVAERLFAWRYHMGATVTPERFTVEALRSALEAHLDTLATPLGSMVRRWLPQDPTNEFLAQLARHVERPQPTMLEGVWFDAARGRALLMAETASPGFDMHAQQDVQVFLDGAFNKIKGEQALTMVLAGPSVVARKSKQAVEGDAWWLTLASTLLVFIVLTLAYRSARLTAIAFLPVASGVVAAIGAVGLGFGTCHMITIGFGATLIGEAVDYPTYLFVQRRADESIIAAARRIGPNLRLAILTTVLGSAAMLASSFNGVAQLGLFTVVGVGVAGLVTRFVIPALTVNGRWHAVAEFTGHGNWLDPTITKARRGMLIVPVILLVSIAYLGTQYETLWERDLERLNPVAEADKQLDQEMRDTMNAPDVRYLVSVRAADVDAVLNRFEALHALLDKLIEDKMMGGYDSPARYVPGTDVQRRRIAALPPADVLEARLRQAQAGLPFRDNLFAPFLRDVERVRNGPLMTPADVAGTPWRSAVDALLVDIDGQWTGLAPLAVVRDANAIEKAVSALDDPAIALFDLKRESDLMLSTHARRSVSIALFGLAIITVVLLLGTRDVRRVGRIVLPVFTAMTATAALLVLCGTRVSFIHVVSLLLVLGTGVNYSLFFSSAVTDAAERARTARAIGVATLTTACGFGVLAFAATPVLHAIGVTVVLGAALSFVFSAIWSSRPAANAGA
jgi:predicted exporter